MRSRVGATGSLLRCLPSAAAGPLLTLTASANNYLARLQGQTQGKARPRHSGGPSADYDEPGGGGGAAHSYGSRGSPPVPGSPLTYSPQVPMEPIPKGEEYGRGGSVYGQSEFAG